MTLAAYRALVDLDGAVSIESDSRWAESLVSVLAALGVDVPDGVSIDQQLQALHGVLALADEHSAVGLEGDAGDIIAQLVEAA